MSKTSTDLTRHALNGPTMGTRWAAQFEAPTLDNPAALHAALTASADLVDAQMSTWKPTSDLMRINGAPTDAWIPIPEQLMDVLARGLDIGRRSDGAFDIGIGDIVTAWGFGPHDANAKAIRAARSRKRVAAHDILELDRASLRVRKHAAITLDLSGIAKGYAVDRMMTVLDQFGINNALVGLDGELRARGRRADGRLWTVALERPDFELRAPLSILELADCAVATSGDYRHWIDLGDKRLSHTMHPAVGAPLSRSPASVTVLTENCMDADAWATALMVLGTESGAKLAEKRSLKAIFVERTGNGLRQIQVG